MKPDPLDNAEDQRFTKHVLAYNQEKNGKKKDRLYKGIKERTTLLIFLLSKRRLLLSPDEATAILLECEKEMDRIISAFKVAGCTYNQYLLQMCRYRGRRIIRREWEKNNLEESLIREEAVPYYIEERFNDDVYTPPILPSVETNNVFNMNLKELVKYIIKTIDRRDYPVFSKSEKNLQALLEDPYERKCLLYLLLTVADEGTDQEARNYARVFQTDEEAFQCFFQKRREKLEGRNEKYEENMRLVAKHWRIMVNLKNTIEKEYDKTKKQQLLENFRSQSICHRRRLHDAQKCRRGMTQAEIAELMDLSRATVSACLSEAKKLLQIVNDLPSVSRDEFTLS